MLPAREVRFLRRTNENSHDPVLTLTTMNGAVTDVVVSTSTPPPLNGVGVNGNGPAPANDSGTLKFTTGLILPPPDVKCTSVRRPWVPHQLTTNSYAHLRF
jgi:hypothetical protein